MHRLRLLFVCTWITACFLSLAPASHARVQKKTRQNAS